MNAAVSETPRARRRWFVAALVVALSYLVVLWTTAPAIGFVRDEGYYFKAAEDYIGWFGEFGSSSFADVFSERTIARHFDYNKEHPPLAKLSQGLTHHVFHRWLGVASPSQGFRAAGFLFAACSVLATFFLGRMLVSSRVGLLAAIGLASMPRYFFDAHLACFDVPMTAMWVASLAAWHRATQASDARPWRAALLAGLAFGFALATKLNALFLPFVFVVVWFVSRRSGRAFALGTGPSGGRDLELPSLPKALIACAVIGPIVFVATWPHLWHDTFARIGEYVGFHLHHEHYPISWFHDLLVEPPFPWSFPVVMSFYTMPSPIFVLGSIGFCVSVVRLVKTRDPGDALLVVATFVPFFLIALPTTPIFGGVKHWYNAMPTLAVLAARTCIDAVDGIANLVHRMKVGALRVAAEVGAAALFLGPGIAGSIASHPNGIGYYNELAGGFVGGAKLGLQRGFWGGLSRPLYDDLGQVDRTTRVFFNRTNYDSVRMYQREGLVSNRVHYANEAKTADIGLHFEQPEHGEHEGEIWSHMGTRPIAGVYEDNVTLIQMYDVRRSNSPP